MSDGLSRHPFVHNERLDRLSRAELLAYRARLDYLLRSVQTESTAERHLLNALKKRTGSNWTLGALGLATLVGGFTAPADEGALFWLIASGALGQIGITRCAEDATEIAEIESRVAMLATTVIRIQRERHHLNRALARA